MITSIEDLNRWNQMEAELREAKILLGHCKSLLWEVNSGKPHDKECWQKAREVNHFLVAGLPPAKGAQ